MGELAYLQGSYQQAVDHWQSALATFNKIDTEPDLFVVYDWLQKGYAEIDPSKALQYSSLYSARVKDWMSVQNNRVENPELQAFNTRVDAILAARQAKAEQLTLLRRYWPYAAIALVLAVFIVMQFQAAVNKRKLLVLEEKLRAERAARADAIIDQIIESVPRRQPNSIL